MATKKKLAEDIERGGDILAAPESPAFDDTVAAMAERRVLHANGKPIPEEYAHLIAYEATDEGIAERNAARAEPSGVSVTGDRWDKLIAKGSDAATSREVWEDENPLNAAVARATGGRETGMSFKLLSDRVNQRKGMRGYVPARDAATGEVILVANMVLGTMPEGKREQRNRHYQRKSAELMESVEQIYAADQDRSIRAAGSEGVSVLRSGEELHDHRNPERVASMGVRVSRGEQ